MCYPEYLTVPKDENGCPLLRLQRIRAMYAMDETFRSVPPVKRQAMRDAHLRPLMNSFFEWVASARTEAQGRNLATKALGKAWVFYGSDTHAESAAAIFTIIASCRLHSLDPQTYLDEVLRLLPYWPKERYLELAPKYWLETRAKLSAKELERPLGDFTIPAP